VQLFKKEDTFAEDVTSGFHGEQIPNSRYSHYIWSLNQERKIKQPNGKNIMNKLKIYI